MAVKKPEVSIKVSPLESVFEVSMPSNAKIDWLDDYFRFSVSADGTVIINDNEFSSKKQAAQALKAMADFLSK
jgi:hypothetical protein